MSLPTTTMRVAQNTAEDINTHILLETEQRIARIAAAGPGAIEARLAQLEREWDVERTLEANAASIVLLGVGLGALVDRKFFLVPAVVGGFLLQHALQGWCPPLPIFRRLGVRTAREIAEERDALKALRGDFRGTSIDGESPAPVGQALRAARI